MREEVSDDCKFFERCVDWFRFQISAIRLFVCFFTNLVAKWWKCENCFFFNDFAGYKETIVNFWYKLNCDY